MPRLTVCLLGGMLIQLQLGAFAACQQQNTKPTDLGDVEEIKNLRKEKQRIIEGRPKVEWQIHKMICYKDGIVVYAAFQNRTITPLRLHLNLAPLQFHGKKFLAGDGSEWEIPALSGHYLFEPATEKNTLLIPAGKLVNLILIVKGERPILQPSKQAVGAGPGTRPTKLEYQFKSGSLFYGEKMSADLVEVHITGQGSFNVEWKGDKLPESAVTKVLEKLPN